jgi:hypothetical protein
MATNKKKAMTNTIPIRVRRQGQEWLIEEHDGSGIIEKWHHIDSRPTEQQAEQRVRELFAAED